MRLSISIDDALFDGRLVFGANKTVRGFVVMPLACGAVFLAGNFVAAESLRSAGNSRRPMWAEALGAAVTVTLLPLAVSRFPAMTD